MQSSPVKSKEKITVDLSGVPETLLWALGLRAHEARTNPGFFSDPMSVELAERIDADVAMFGKPNPWFAVRAKYSDELVRRYLERHPEATVVSLGEGLETQFWRVDNGRLRWVSVDLPEAIALRQRLLPESQRLTNLESSALDPGWMDGVDASSGLFISAGGLLMYFKETEVVDLLTRIAERFGSCDAELFFDTIPPWLSRRTLGKGWKPSKRYQTPPMPFGIRKSELEAFTAKIPRLQVLTSLLYFKAFPRRARLLALVARLPWFSDNGPVLVQTRIG